MKIKENFEQTSKYVKSLILNFLEFYTKKWQPGTKSWQYIVIRLVSQAL